MPSISKRFELPALNFSFGSLTEGTNIPPPLDSPVQEVPTPPKTPVAAEKTVSKEENKLADVSSTPRGANGGPMTITTAGTKRPTDDIPLSPAPSGKAGGLRRLLSRNLLNNAYAEGEPHSTVNGTNGANNGAVSAVPTTPGTPGARPMSRSSGSILDDKKMRRGSGFFRRLKTNETGSLRRNGSVYEHTNGNNSRPEIRGPPPPMIPELSALESKVDVTDGGSLGTDLFKNIK